MERLAIHPASIPLFHPVAAKIAPPAQRHPKEVKQEHNEHVATRQADNPPQRHPRVFVRHNRFTQGKLTTTSVQTCFGTPFITVGL